MDLKNVIGLGGVPEEEIKKIKKLGRLFVMVRMAIVILMALQWHADLTDRMTILTLAFVNWIIWLYFILEISILCFIVKNKKEYLKYNWFFFVILLLLLPTLFNIRAIFPHYDQLKIFLVLVLLIPWVEVCQETLSDNHLGTTLLSAFVITVLAGVIIAGIDPNIPTPWDGIWWAWVTVSTVGYGDMVPKTIIGRIFGAVLIVMGLGLFAVITANFSAIFVRKKVSDEYRMIKEMIREMNIVQDDEDQIIQLLMKLNDRMERLEKKIDEK